MHLKDVSGANNIHNKDLTRFLSSKTRTTFIRSHVLEM